MSLTIRPAVIADAPAIAALEAACFSLPRLQAQIEREIGNFLTACEDGEISGYIDAAVVLDEGYIGNIAVLPDQRGRGIGRALLHTLRERHRGALAFLTLEVRASNAPAIALYASEGFQQVGVRKGMYEQPKEDALLMTYYY